MDSPQADFDQILSEAVAPWGLELSASQLEQLRTHYAMMIETNRTMNLTRITDPLEAATKHYADSLAIAVCARVKDLTVHTVLDIGSGAGFPSIPLAVAHPEWSITAIDGTGKKIDFVRRAAETLGLSNIQCVHANTTNWKSGDTFDLVTMRAVANPVEVGKPFVAVGGHIIYYGRKIEQPDGPTRKTYPYRLTIGEETLYRHLRVFGPRPKSAH